MHMKRKGLFLDRDGVINEELNYLHKIEDVVFIDEIFDVAKFYAKNDFDIFIITNQAGIARGYFTEEDFDHLSTWIINEFSIRGIIIKKIYHCPHHPDYTGACQCRKPNPGMILQAKEEFDIDLSHSVLVGDKTSDIEAGLNAGITHSYHIEEILNNIDNLPLP